MIKLIVFPAGLGLYCPSPFCIKAAYLLQMSGFEWQREDLEDPRKMPMGKLPAMRVDGKIIADSEAIRAYIEDTGKDLDAGLSDVDRAISRTVIRMVEEHLYFQLLHDRWANDVVWKPVREAYFSHLPPVVRHLVPAMLRRDILRTLKGHGILRYSDAERLARADKDLKAISDLLGDKPFLMGENVTAADCSVAAILGVMRVSPVPSDLSQRVADNPRLSAYLDRVETEMALT